MLESIIFIVSFLVGYILGKRRGKTIAFRYLTIEQTKARHDDLQKILQYISVHDSVSDHEVERMFNVPRHMADAYLKDLEHQGMIVCVNKTKDVETYTLK